MMNKRTYHELRQLHTFEERFEYLRINAKIGLDTFGFDRYLNQAFYTSDEWRSIRLRVIERDNGCDLGIDGRTIHGPIYIHHMNPMKVIDLVEFNLALIDPEFLICCSFNTHNAIHYGDINSIIRDPIVRMPNDTCPWKK